MDQVHIAVDQVPTDFTAWLGIVLGPAVTAIGFIFIWLQLREASRQTKFSAEAVAQASLQTKYASEQAVTAAQEASAQRQWKKSEYLNLFANKFFGDVSCDQVINLIDYAARPITINLDDGTIKTIIVLQDKKYAATTGSGEYEDAGTLEEIEQVKDVDFKAGFEQVILCEALRYHRERGRFSLAEYYIRSQFDTFFFNLDQFHLLIENKLYNFREIDIYIHYVLDLLTGRKDNVSGELVECLQKYCEHYDFAGATKLIDKAKRLRPPNRDAGSR